MNMDLSDAVALQDLTGGLALEECHEVAGWRGQSQMHVDDTALVDLHVLDQAHLDQAKRSARSDAAWVVHEIQTGQDLAVELIDPAAAEDTAGARHEHPSSDRRSARRTWCC